MRRLLTVLLFATLVAFPAFGQGIYVYPQKGQSPQQQARDEGECQSWARNQTGYDPMRAPGSSKSALGGAVRGGAGGAALGAAIGAISMLLEQCGYEAAAQRVLNAIQVVTGQKMKSQAAGKMGYST